MTDRQIADQEARETAQREHQDRLAAAAKIIRAFRRVYPQFGGFTDAEVAAAIRHRYPSAYEELDEIPQSGALERVRLLERQLPSVR